MCALLMAAACGRNVEDLASGMRDGDIIFQESRSDQSRFIRQATGSRYTHVGLIFIREGGPEVLEAVGPVRYTPLAEWIARGKDGHCVVKRVCDGRHALTRAMVEKLRAAAEGYLDRPYDRQFNWSDDRLYCSELVWKAYHEATGLELGQLSRLGDWVSDAEVRQEVERRHGSNPPLDSPVIAPVDIMKSNDLCEVGRR